MELITDVGPISLRLAAVRTGLFDAGDARDLLRMEDGAMLALNLRGQTYLVVDHRTDRERPARIEFWECAGAGPEMPLGGLYALCDAAADR